MIFIYTYFATSKLEIYEEQIQAKSTSSFGTKELSINKINALNRKQTYEGMGYWQSNKWVVRRYGHTGAKSCTKTGNTHLNVLAWVIGPPGVREDSMGFPRPEGLWAGYNNNEVCPGTKSKDQVALM